MLEQTSISNGVKKIIFIISLCLLVSAGIFGIAKESLAAGCETIEGCGGTAGCPGFIWGCCEICDSLEVPYTECKTGPGDICECHYDQNCILPPSEPEPPTPPTPTPPTPTPPTPTPPTPTPPTPTPPTPTPPTPRAGHWNLTPCFSDEVSAIADPQPLSIKLDWDDAAGADHYELYYKKTTEEYWTDRYPDISEFTLTGLSPSGKLPENPVVYQWYVISCANPDCSVSQNSQACLFVTEELVAPYSEPSDISNGGSFVPLIVLINPLKANTLWEAFQAILSFLLILAFALAPILIIYAAILILGSHGDPQKIALAKKMIFWTLIALFIILLANAIPSLIKGILGGGA